MTGSRRLPGKSFRENRPDRFRQRDAPLLLPHRAQFGPAAERAAPSPVCRARSGQAPAELPELRPDRCAGDLSQERRKFAASTAIALRASRCARRASARHGRSGRPARMSGSCVASVVHRQGRRPALIVARNCLAASQTSASATRNSTPPSPRSRRLPFDDTREHPRCCAVLLDQQVEPTAVEMPAGRTLGTAPLPSSHLGRFEDGDHAAPQPLPHAHPCHSHFCSPILHAPLCDSKRRKYDHRTL